MSLESKIPPLLLLLIGLVVMALLAQTSVVKFESQPLLALVILVLGIAVALCGVYEFRQAQTTVDPRSPQSSSSLVDTGIYRFSRNPMYVGFALTLFAWGLWLGEGLGFLAIVLFIAYMNRFQISPEERALAASFGEPYKAYLKQVRRWL